MSCHDIGRGMNEVVRMTISLYDEGEISRESAIKIIATCGVAVNWCDGNTGEALEYISECRCGKCLNLVPKGERLYSIWDLPYDFARENNITMEKLRLASFKLCDSCFNLLLGEYDVENLKESIVKHSYTEDRYTSVGSHPDDNNGYRWVRGTDWYD